MNTSFYHSVGLLCGIWFHLPLFSSRNPLLFSIFHDTIIFSSSALSSWSFEPTYPVVSPLEYHLKHCKFSASEIKCVIKFHQRMVLRIEEGFLSVALRLGREANGHILERFWSSRYYSSNQVAMQESRRRVRPQTGGDSYESRKAEGEGAAEWVMGSSIRKLWCW